MALAYSVGGTVGGEGSLPSTAMRPSPSCVLFDACFSPGVLNALSVLSARLQEETLP